MSYYRICPYCGAALDPGERCEDCNEKKPAGAATPTDFKAEQKVSENQCSASQFTEK